MYGMLMFNFIVKFEEACPNRKGLGLFQCEDLAQ